MNQVLKGDYRWFMKSSFVNECYSSFDSKISSEISFESSLNDSINSRKSLFIPKNFIRDFKQICCVSPNLFFENMSDFYNEPFKYYYIIKDIIKL